MREELFKNCTLCPRKCNVNRLEGKRGYCGMDSTIRASHRNGKHAGTGQVSDGL